MVYSQLFKVVTRACDLSPSHVLYYRTFNHLCWFLPPTIALCQCLSNRVCGVLLLPTVHHRVVLLPFPPCLVSLVVASHPPPRRALSPSLILCYCLFNRVYWVLLLPTIHHRVVLLRFQPSVLSPAAASHPPPRCAIAFSTVSAESCCCLSSTPPFVDLTESIFRQLLAT